MPVHSRRSLTVIIPNYNHAHFLVRCLNSILSQSRLPDEVLICDDASTDESLEVLHEIARDNQIVRVIRNEYNLGVSKTIQRLLEEASGDLALGCAVDDEIAPEFIRYCMEEAEAFPSHGMYMGYTVVKYSDRTTGEEKEKLLAPGINLRLSPDVFAQVPSEIRPWLTNIISISSIIQRQKWMEILEHAVRFGPQGDVCYRALIAAKYGLSIINRSGAIVHQRRGSYSAQNDSMAFHVQTAENYIELARFIRSPEVREYFPKKLREELTNAWLNEAESIICKKIKRQMNQTGQDYIFCFKKQMITGSFIARILAKIHSLSGALSLFWIRYQMRKLKRCFD